MKKSIQDTLHYQTYTQVASAADYLNGLTQDTLVVYSPTSLLHLPVKNSKVHMIDSRIFGRNVVFIKALAQSRQTYKTIVSLGGGTATDVAKFIAYQSKAKFVCIPSMLSTNAYGTNKVALVVEGEKVTLDAKLADRILLDTSLLQTSPQQNLYGLADVLSIHTALQDWRVAEKKGLENVDENIFEQSTKLLSEAINFILNTDINHIAYEIPALYRLIGESAYITNVYGTGRPESGSEHIFAKALEKQVDIPHGVSVSFGILLMSILQDSFSKELCDSIHKIGTLKFAKEMGISRSLIKSVLLNIVARDDRYSVLNEVSLDENRVEKLLNDFSDKTGIELE